MENRVFLLILGAWALVWYGLGALLYGGDPNTWDPFHSIYRIILLDLASLILLFRKLIFDKRRGFLWNLQVSFYFIFKLVCFGFLAITLKRLRNDPVWPVGLAVLFIGTGPLVAGVLTRLWTRNKVGN